MFGTLLLPVLKKAHGLIDCMSKEHGQPRTRNTKWACPFLGDPAKCWFFTKEGVSCKEDRPKREEKNLLISSSANGIIALWYLDVDIFQQQPSLRCKEAHQKASLGTRAVTVLAATLPKPRRKCGIAESPTVACLGFVSPSPKVVE